MTRSPFKLISLSVVMTMVFAVVALAAGAQTPISDGGANDQQPSSVLVYNFYTSSPTDSDQETKFNITNTSLTQNALVHLFFLRADDCAVTDNYICLTPNQTASFLASDVDPGVTGYMIAVVVDQPFGLPLGFNNLIGSEFVKLSSKHEAKLNAEGFQALFEGTVPSPNGFLAVLAFDGVSYTKAARTLALDHIPSYADGNRTIIVVNSFNGNLATGLNGLGAISGILYDDGEVPYSFNTTTTRCQLLRTLANDFPVTTPQFSAAIPSGRSGWMKFFTTQDRGISGASIYFNNYPKRRTSFNGGSNLHRLTTTGAASLTIPVFPPSC